MKEKKGDMTIGTLIAIILGLVVLVLLIVGFTGGWNNFMDKLNIFGGGKSTLSDVEAACSLACSTGSKVDYCSIKQNLQEGGYSVKMTCNELEERKGSIYLGGEKITLGIEPCSAVDCGIDDPLTNKKLNEYCEEKKECEEDLECSVEHICVKIELKDV